MLSAIGQNVALVTYAQATLRGEPIDLDWKSNPWFAHTAEYAFGVGDEGGPSQGDDPNAWFETLRAAGFTDASLFAEPFKGSWDIINSTGFAGGLRIAPVTFSPSVGKVIWHESTRFDKEAKMWHVRRGGYQLDPETPRVRAKKGEAGLALDAALGAMVEFQRSRRPDEPQWSEMFERGRRILQATGLAPTSIPDAPPETETLDRVRPLFPSDPDPQCLALVAAVEAAWALGGMGWWNDWGPRDDAFAAVTFSYYEALLAALVAACEPA